MENEFKIDKLIDEAITSLVEDTPKQAAECLQELAQSWAKAGLTQQSFLDIRQHIVMMAEKQSGAAFIREKLQLAERTLMEARTGSPILIVH